MSEVIRTFGWMNDGEPAMAIRRRIDPEGCTPVVIRLQDIWMFSEDHNPDFNQTMFNLAANCCEIFGLGLITTQKMAGIATVIEEGIDELVKMPPRAALDKERALDEIQSFEITDSGISLSFEMDEPIPL